MARYSGVRSSSYGAIPWPTNVQWKNAATNQIKNFPDTSSVFIWIVGVLDENNGKCNMEFPAPPGDWTNVNFADTDKHESILSYFDSNNIKVYLQFENGIADVEDCINIVLTKYGNHSCVIGAGMDWEWYGSTSVDDPNETTQVTDQQAEDWEDLVKTYDTDYKLFIKHYMSSLMPPSYRGNLVFINDSQGFANLNAMISEFATWADTFSNNEVGFQFGYDMDIDTLNDYDWWKLLDNPPKQIGDRVFNEVQNSGQDCGVYWVDFTLWYSEIDLLKSEIWYDNFSTDKNWTLDSGAVWERGAPVQDPPGSAYDGSNVIATDLNANYPNNISPMSYATSPIIDCSGYNNVAISFRRHAYFENTSDYDRATVEVYDGNTWHVVFDSDDIPDNIEDSEWTLQSPDISTYGDNNDSFRIRFGLESDTSTSYRGWFIDAVRVIGDVATNYKIEGKTYDKNGSIIASVKCLLLKDNQNNTCTVIDYTTSDANGDYSFTGLSDNDAQYLVYAWKDDTPHVFDVTNHNLLPKETPDTSFDLYLRSDVDKGETSPDKDLRLRSDADKIVGSHTVIFHCGCNGYLSGADATQSVSHGGDSTAITAVADGTYVFNGWTGDYTGLNNPLQLNNVITDMDVTANFGIFGIENPNYMYRINNKQCVFCGNAVPDYTSTYCDCSTQPYSLLSGVREGAYGLASNEATHEDWTNAMWGMHWRCGRAQKVGLFNISHIIGNDCQFGFENPGGVSDPNITFTGTDIHSSLFSQFDNDGDIDIYLGLELGEADATEALQVALDKYGGHNCVKGIVIDLEWWNVNGSGNYDTQLPAATAEGWLNVIQEYDENYKLILRHPDPDILPDNPFSTDIWVNCDDQGFIGLGDSTTTGDWMIPMFKTFADSFSDHTCFFQIGYNDIWSGGGETRNDKDWWGNYDNPPTTICKAIIDYIAADRTDQAFGIVWADFSLEDEEIDLLDTPDSTHLWNNCPLHNFSIAGAGLNIPANVPVCSECDTSGKACW